MRRELFAENPRITTDDGKIYEVHEDNNWYKIMTYDTNAKRLSDTSECVDDQTMLFLWWLTPIFESKIQAISYMLENYRRFI